MGFTDGFFQGFDGGSMALLEREREKTIAGAMVAWSMKLVNLPPQEIMESLCRVSGGKERREN